MSKKEEKESFGKLLRIYRERAYVKHVGRLSQVKFAQLLSKRTGLMINRNHVGRWEKDTNIIQANDRITLVAIIAILAENQGIKSLEDASDLLKAGHYEQLNDEEITKVNAQWEMNTSNPETEKVTIIPSKATENLGESPHAIMRLEAENPIPIVIHRTVIGPGSAPPPPSIIVGRDDDMYALKEYLKIGSKKKHEIPIQILTAIKGWPGVGKTTIASALAHDEDIQKEFPDGVLWVSLGQEPNLLSEIAAWGRALGTDELLHAKTLDEARAQLAALLRNRRMLLIIDDVWITEHAAPFNVGGSNCATLITTRRDDIAVALAPTASNIYRLKVLKDEDALALLKQLAPTVVTMYPLESLMLVQELEGLPLALQVAGRLLNTEVNRGFGVIELIDELRQGAKLLEAQAPIDRAELANETTPTIAALLQTSLDLLDDPTRDYYAYLGVFAPKPATFDIDAMKFVWQLDDPKPVIKNLVDRGLLEFVPDLERYQMHALLVMLAKSLLTD
jgi:hypothetical protein